MNKLDPNKVFSLFDATDEDAFDNAGASDIFNTPNVLLTSVINGLENFKFLDRLYKAQSPDKYNELRDRILHKYNNILFNYLSRIDLDLVSEEDLNTLRSGASQKVKALSTLSDFYIGIEEYEKCAFIKRLTDIIISEV